MMVADQTMMLSMEISLVHRRKYVTLLSPVSHSVDSLVFALYDRNTRMLVFLVAVVSLNSLNSTFWVSKAILNMTSFGPCMVENPPFTIVYLA